jgi:hypothetical protein
MVENLTPKQIYTFIVSDFEAAWNSIADKRAKIGRGNFMFARQAMNLLEFAARAYGNDVVLHKIFSEILSKIEPKYFTVLPGRVYEPKHNEFTLPRLGNKNILLWSLFDLIRNGLAHQYQQIIAELADKKHFYVSLGGGATHHRYLSKIEVSRSSRHLDYAFTTDGDLKLYLDPGTLFLDFKNAILNSHLLKKAPPFLYLGPRSRPNYDFDVKALEKSLIDGGYKRLI